MRKVLKSMSDFLKGQFIFPKQPALTWRLFAESPECAKWQVKGPGRPGFSPQTATARAAAVLPAVEKRVVRFLPGSLCSFLYYCGDLLCTTVPHSTGIRWDQCWAALELQAPSAGLPHRKSGKLARGVAEAFLLDVRLTSDRHFHYKILDLWKQSGSFSVLFSVGLHISAKTNSSASWKMTI